MSDWFFNPLRKNHYGVINIDPPTKFSAGTKGRPQHYPRMTWPQIKALPVGDLAAADCHLFFWISSPHFPRAWEMANAWGFRYSARAFVWIKLQAAAARTPKLMYDVDKDVFMGQGFTTRKNAEDCLLFKRGKPKRLSASVREPIISPIREHSRKPDEAYERIQTYAAGPYADLFGRQERQGWDVWGNETGKFGEVA